MIDHILFLARDLESGCDAIEAQLGVRPPLAGRHPVWGTHNALLSIGPRTYLEVIARDPSLSEPERGVLFGDRVRDELHLLTWVAAREDLEQAHRDAADAGVELGAIAAGSRERPDGSRVHWRLTDPAPLPFDGIVPFVIAWGDSPHPAQSAPPAGELIGLTLEHPRADEARPVLAALGSEVELSRGPVPRIEARIRTADGVVRLS